MRSSSPASSSVSADSDVLRNPFQAILPPAAINMKTKTISSVLFSISIAGIILIIPYLFICDIEKALTLGANLLMACATLATFIIAFLFYDKFGIGKKIIDKQTETVIELLEKCKKIMFVFENPVDTEKGLKETLFLRGFSKDLKYFKSSNLNNKYVLFIFSNYNDEMNQILQFLKNIWLPLEIKESLLFLDLYTLTSVDLSSTTYHNNYILINVNRTSSVEEKKDFGIKNKENIKYIDFIENIEKSIVAIENWINEHSNINITLNI